MIYCTIDGKTVYPESGTNIKITIENPYLKEEGSHTYEISFPLNIAENRVVFGSVHRMDVSKKNREYNDCALYSGSVRLLCGVGKVVSYTNENIKLQIIAETQSARTKAMEKFIDRVNFPALETTIKEWCGKKWVIVDQTVPNNGYAGIKGKYVFFSVKNSTSGIIYNQMNKNYFGGLFYVNDIILIRPVIQPNLMYVLHNVMQSIGYEVVENDFDRYPWNTLYIVNIKRTVTVEGALPHWKITTFIKEFCNLFNATLIYDESNKTVKIKSFSTVGSSDRIDIFPEREYSSEYDEEGISYIESDDIEYSLSQCDDEKYPRFVSDEALKYFTLRHYATLAEMYSAVANLTEKEKLTSIFLCDNTGYRYYRRKEEDEQTFIEEIPFAFFTKLKRERGEDEEGSTRSLRIVPVKMGESEITYNEFGLMMPGTDKSKLVDKCVMPYKEGEDDESEEIGADEDYTTVQDVVENSNSIEEDTEDEVMELAFLDESKRTYALDVNGSTAYMYVLMSYCDQRESNVSRSVSMALTEPGHIVDYIGTFHKKTMQINPNNQFVKTFLTNSMPDIKSVFCIRNKLYLCAKIEATVNDSGIDQLKKGYFYEIL